MKALLGYSCLVAAIFATGVNAQSWPAKPVRIITVAAGGAVDLSARLMSQGMARELGQPFIVDNRAANSGIETAVMNSPPDGSTLLYWSNALWLAPFLRDVNYDPVKDFAPVSLVATGVQVVVVNAALPANTLAELVALAKARPGTLNVAVTTPGSSGHLSPLVLKTMAGIDITLVGYKSAVQAIADLTAGRVQVMVPILAAVLPAIKAGKLRALAVTTTMPSELLPGVPPVATLYPGYEQGSMHVLFAPGKTPAAIVSRIHQEAVKAVRLPEVKDKLLALAVEVVASTPQQLAAVMQADMARTGKIIKDNGIKSDE